MILATMTTKGQLTVPKEVRDELGLTAGTAVSFARNADGTYTLARGGGSVMALAGCLTPGGAATSRAATSHATTSLAAMERAISDGAIAGAMLGGDSSPS